MRTGVAAIALSLLLTVSHGIRTPVGAQSVAGVPDVRDAVAEISRRTIGPTHQGVRSGSFVPARRR